MANQQSTLTVGAGLVAGTKQAFQTIASGMAMTSTAMKAQATAMKSLGKGAESKVFANTAKQLDAMNSSLNEQLGIFDIVLKDQPQVAAGYDKMSASAQKFSGIVDAQGKHLEPTTAKMTKMADMVNSLRLRRGRSRQRPRGDATPAAR